MARPSTTASTGRKRPASSSSSSSSRSTKRPRRNCPFPDELSLEILQNVDLKDLPAAALLSRPMLRAAQELLFTSTTLSFVVRTGNRGMDFFSSGSGVVLSKEDKGKYGGLLRGLARTVVKTLTFAITDASDSQSFTRATPASEAIADVFKACVILEELIFPDNPHGTLLRLVPVLPSLPTLTSLSFCPGTMNVDAFNLFTLRAALDLTRLTLATHEFWLTPFNLSAFVSLVELHMRCTGKAWGPSTVAKYLGRLDLPTRCPSLGRIVFTIPGSAWRRQPHLRDRPPIHSVILKATNNVEVLVKMEGWELSITNKPGKEWDWTDLNKKEEEEEKAEEKEEE
ncbi:hypothetical protein JCM6882_004050 [Rhodosporidiobolus microsporus]